ncbi:MAG: 4a-hydroxytetrahydrobiopterin dehydratase [Gordonia sp. (in: high G+C Gram-positive bacteria)]|uniref:4a-hydroxytetrahydrobiopterin dehydratase n=1 Tax=Gordonia sp. (in: high G+C Gram-positive bacteria) TaxID=84139 RepID=UPI003C779A75
MEQHNPDPHLPARLTEAEAMTQTSEAWAVVDGELVASFWPGTMVSGLDLVTAVVAAAEASGHHPDIDLRYSTVAFRIVTHSAGQLTELDVALAQWIDEIAAAQGVVAVPRD